MDGFLLIDKPAGITSQDVVYRVKKKLNLDKVGHTGTLDPFATGLLVLCIGKASKIAYLPQGEAKEYTGTILLGKHYDTLDVTGELKESMVVNVTEKQIDTAMQQMKGLILQTPPMFSSVKHQGKRLYELARTGIEVKRLERPVHIYDFHRTSTIENDAFTFYAQVSKGTYIRQLAVDLGKSTHHLAVLSTLRRESIGPYHIKHSKKIEDVTHDDILSFEHIFKNTQRLILSDYLIRLVKNGVYLDERQIKTDYPFLVVDQHDHLIAYYDVIQPLKYRPILIF